MKTYQRIFLFVGLALAVTALLSPWAAVSWAMIIESRPQWHRYGYSFSRIFDRVFMLSAIASFLILRRRLKLGSLRQLGLLPATHAARDVGLGAALAIGSTVVLLGAMTAAGIFTPFFRLAPPTALARLGAALLAAVAVSVVEEIFFRGILFKGLRQSFGRGFACMMAALIFSAIHFIRPANDALLTRADPWAGMRHLAGSFHLFLDPIAIAPGLFGLFLIGATLCYAYEKAGNLYLSIGLHAGWVFALKAIRVFGDYSRLDLGWVFGSGDPKIVSGAATWLGVLMVGLAIHNWPSLIEILSRARLSCRRFDLRFSRTSLR